MLLSCEHGGRLVPPRYRRYFRTRAAREALASHRGWDPGSLSVARKLSLCLAAPLVASRTSRLLVELNRSPHHPQLLSEFSRPIAQDPAALEELLAVHYHPHRDLVREQLREAIADGGRVVHIGVHSFTPRLGGKTRAAELGLLYDPARPGELDLATAWAKQLRARRPEWRTRRNYPYRGNADGLTTALRREFGEGDYLGLELEMNQALFSGPRGTRPPAGLVASLADTLLSCLRR